MDKKSTQRWVIGLIFSASLSIFLFVAGLSFNVWFSSSASATVSNEHAKLGDNQKQILSAVSRAAARNPEPELALTKRVALIDVLTDANGHQVAESFRDLFVNIGSSGGKNVSTQWKNVLAELPGTKKKFYSPETDKVEPATPMALGPNDRTIMPELPNVFQSSIGYKIKTATAELDVKYDGIDEISHCKSYSAKFVRAVDGGLVLYMSEIKPEPRRIASLDAPDWF